MNIGNSSMPLYKSHKSIEINKNQRMPIKPSSDTKKNNDTFRHLDDCLARNNNDSSLIFLIKKRELSITIILGTCS